MAGRWSARVLDLTAHPLPPSGELKPGPGSFNTMIGSMPAWRGMPAAAAAALKTAKQAADRAIDAAEMATRANTGQPGYAAAKSAEMAVKAASKAALAAQITSSAGGADIHACIHGPGAVIDGSKTVMINNLPASRVGDTLIEASGPPNKIVMGLPTVLIGG